MLNSGKFQIAAPGQSSRSMSLAEVNLGLASGDVLPDDQYWVKGMPRWEKVKDLPGIILPPTPKARPSAGTAAPIYTSEPRIEPSATTRNETSHNSLSFWAQPDLRPRLSVWSPAAYATLSLFFTPLLGSALIAQNHRATEETAWRAISWFWIVVWSLFIISAIALHFASVACGPLLYWEIGYAALGFFWCFTCAIPHGNFLKARTYDAAWHRDWIKPIGFGLTAWIIVATVFLLTR